MESWETVYTSVIIFWRLAETCYNVVSVFMRRVTVLLDTTASTTKPDKSFEAVDSNELLLQVTTEIKTVDL